MKLMRCSYPNCPKILSRKEIDENFMHVEVPELPKGSMIAMICFCDSHQDMFFEIYGHPEKAKGGDA